MHDQILLLSEFQQTLRDRHDAVDRRPTDKHTTKLLFYIFAGTRGGITRLRLIMRLLEKPRNANQLAGDLGLDYKAIKHHMKVLERNSMVSKIGDEQYGVLYRISDLLEINLPTLDAAIDKLSSNMSKKNRKKVYL